MIFYWGCMNSAKSLNLLATAYNFKEKGIPFMIIKSSLDTRDGDKIKSRTGMEADCAVIPPDTDIFKVVKQYNNFRTFEGKCSEKYSKSGNSSSSFSLGSKIVVPPDTVA